jgi:hypothetical protein
MENTDINWKKVQTVLLSIFLYILMAISFISGLIKKMADYGINKIKGLQ